MRRPSALGVLAGAALVAAAAGCRGDDAARDAPDAAAPYAPPPERCDAPGPDPAVLAPCNVGGGIYGAWATDDLGLPAYDYGLDHRTDARAVYSTTDGREHRDHWAAFGNHRVNATFSNDGFVQVALQDRGPTWLDVFDEADPDDPTAPRGHGGGYSYLDDGEATWSSAYRDLPRGARATRRFGVGYAEARTEHRGIALVRRTVAPPGDAAWLIDEVTLENRGDRPRALRHYEVWDVARRPIEIDWVVSGKALSGAPKRARSARDARNGLFDEVVAWDAATRTLALRRTRRGPAPTREEPDAVDRYPADPFLAVLAGTASDVYTEDATFWGDGGTAAPRAVVGRAPGELAAGIPAGRSGDGQPRALVVRSDVSLAPGARTTLRFAYGAAPMGQPAKVDAIYTDLARDPRADAAAAIRPSLMRFATPRDPYLHRELAWHSAQLEASVGFREYWGRRVVPQGSAYLYLHGADGATRDIALFAMPLAYTDPALARDQLALTMGLAFAEDSRFSYAFQGHGKLDDALGLHAQPSDLDLFFLLAMVEYLGATGDVSLLDERVSYWPKRPENEATGLDHVRRAVLHLLDRVGFGEHGLVRVGTGDWSDGVVVAAPDRALAIAKGESVPNSQMALVVLPLVADLLEGRDPPLAARIRAALPGLADAVAKTWTGRHFGRVYYGDGVLRGADRVDLEAQVWALLGDLPEDRRGALLDTIARDLDDPSPVGAPLTPGGQVWPAIAQLLTWGYARSDDERAWRHFARSSLVTRARAQPGVWFGIWSGPDGAESTTGATWASPVTPMTDYPTMNMNVHAMALLGALRIAGLEATGRGLAIRPHVPHRALAMRTRVVDLDVREGGYGGVWRPAPRVARVLSLCAPRGARLVGAAVDGAEIEVESGKECVDVPVAAAGNTGVRFDVKIR